MSTRSGNSGQSRTMRASEFKAKSLPLMDEVVENGKPVAKLTAYHERPRIPNELRLGVGNR